MSRFGILTLITFCALHGAVGYEVQPYTPVTNSPAEVVEKQAALVALRSEWDGDNYSASNISSILSKNGVSDPWASTNHFGVGGVWYKTLPTGSSLNGSEYEEHQEFFFDVLALAYLDRFQSSDQKQTFYDALAWYFDNGYAAPHEYHETFSYHNPENHLCGIMVLSGLLMFDDIHTDRAMDSDVEMLFQQMRAFGRAYIQASPQIRGANWSFRIDNCLRYILFTDQAEDMDEYACHWKKALSFNRWEDESDGIHPDWTMMHHGDQNYWGMYGISWTSRVIEFGELFDGKPWAYGTEDLFSGEKISVKNGRISLTLPPHTSRCLIQNQWNVARR